MTSEGEPTEAEVEAALALLLDQPAVPTFDAVRGLVQPPGPVAVPAIGTPVLDFGVYDRLLLGGARDG